MKVRPGDTVYGTISEIYVQVVQIKENKLFVEGKNFTGVWELDQNVLLVKNGKRFKITGTAKKETMPEKLREKLLNFI